MVAWAGWWGVGGVMGCYWRSVDGDDWVLLAVCWQGDRVLTGTMGCYWGGVVMGCYWRFVGDVKGC